MKKNFPITGKEKDLGNRTNILSITDAKGIITYANQEFIDIAGFSREELTGRNHNIIRHPDMPPAAFQDLWDYMKAGKPWMGVVKNRCKNGDHYWVDAFAIPIMEQGAIKECQSVRMRPQRQWIKRAEQLYQRINNGKRLFAPGLAIGLRSKLYVTMAFALSPMAALLIWSGAVSVPVVGSVCLLSLVLARMGITRCYRRLAKLVNHSRGIVNNPISQYVYTGRLDDLSQLELGYKMLESELSAVTGRLADSTSQLDSVAQSTVQTVTKTQQQLQQQQSDTHQVAVAMEQMSSTAEQVAGNAHKAEMSAKAGEKEADSVIQQVNHTLDTVNSMAQGVTQAAEVIQRLQGSTRAIGSVLDVIKAVAEQTNLLALNAAIEAARAGEQGRGFAVVADEVRSLATRTQESTREIEGMIQNLQNEAKQAADSMQLSRHSAEQGVSEILDAGQAMRVSLESIRSISLLNIQIAAAAEEQSQVAANINNNITSINSVSEQTVEAGEETREIAAHLSKQVKSLYNLIHQFRKRLDLVNKSDSADST